MARTQFNPLGQIIEVSEKKTRYGRPYVFVNFGPWKGSIVKLSIWSDGLKKLTLKPDQSWVGRWISVVGLLEPPYVNPKYKYSHIAITIDEANQYRFIDAADAQRRLASIGRAPVTTGGAGNNRAILENITGSTPPRQPAAAPTRGKAKVTQAKTANQLLLEQVQKQAPAAAAPPPSGSRHRPGVSSTPPYSPTPTLSTSPGKPQSKEGGIPGWLWVIGGIVLLVILSKLGR